MRNLGTQDVHITQNKILIIELRIFMQTHIFKNRNIIGRTVL